MERYDHESIEPKWQQEWEQRRTFRVDEAASVSKERRRYVLDMFPYPSAEGLHVGHPEGYTGSDIVARYRRMKGDRVLHPMGFDAFGLPAENYALKTGVHPAVSTQKNIENMRRQIKRLGFSYDWSREVITSDPKYYRWTQWIFLKLYEAGLAYEAMAPINWCPKDKTGLANEEVIDGCCERCGTPVVKKEIRQWLVRITDERYVERLLNDLDPLDWPENIKQLQRNWIGKSEGAEIVFPLEGVKPGKAIIVHGFKDRPDVGWKLWLTKELRSRGWTVEAPQLPGGEYPNLTDNIAIIDRLGVDGNTVLITHSLGGPTALKYLETTGKKIAKLIMVAPPHYPIRTPQEMHRPGVQAYIDWTYDFGKIRSQCGEIIVIADTHDDKVAMKEPTFLAKQLRATFVSERAPRPHYSTREGIGIEEYEAPTILSAAQPHVRTFTTRPDTIFGATYLVFAPEHSFVKTLPAKNRKEVEKYVDAAKRKSDLERSALEKEKTGVELEGVHAINPATGKPIPIWLADYVFMGYGTGAIMAVPAHDERDFAFAKKYHLPIRKVILPLPLASMPRNAEDIAAGAQPFLRVESECWTGEGTLVNSDRFDGTTTEKARAAIPKSLAKRGLGRPQVQYKLRDWVFSRQRYWGEPIPIIHCEKEGIVPLREEDLPLLLPDAKKYEPTGTGEGPLANVKAWVNVTCWRCGSPAKRETNTMPQWAGSNWYFLRYCDPHNSKQLADPEKLARWLPVDLYIGGAEHAVLHLLYARFIYKFLYDIGAVPKSCGDEPFTKLVNQGTILGEDGQKMSKSRGNVLNPDDIVKEYGADTMRMYEMFMGPFSDAKPWSTRGIIGVRRFLDRVYQLLANWRISELAGEKMANSPTANRQPLDSRTHQLTKKVTADVESFKFNTSVAAFMEYTNDVSATPNEFGRADRETFLKLLAPFAPHLAEELWHRLGHEKLITEESWPTYDETALKESTVTVVVQVNGKVRDQLVVAADASETDVRKKALGSEKVQKWLAGKEPKKVVYVKGKVVSIVV